MVEWLDNNVAAWHWMVFGLALALGEMLVTSFFLLLIGISAAIVGLLLLFVPMDFNTQLLVWAGLSVVDVVVWFKFVLPHVPDRTRSGMASEALIGQIGTLSEFNSVTGRGRLRFPAPLVGSDEWGCIGSGGALAAGDRVMVDTISGNDLVVRKHG